MPHCTNNFAWYLGKFIAGFTGMLFVYAVFFKENTNSCTLDEQADANARQEDSPRFMLVAAENLWTWCTRITEWFRENDPAISETALAVERRCPLKNDNDISFENSACYVALPNRKTKDTVTDFWKFCIGNENYGMLQNHVDDVIGRKLCAEIQSRTEEDTKIVNEHEEEIQNNCYCGKSRKNVRSVETEANFEDILRESNKCADEVSLELRVDEVDAKQETSIESTCNFVGFNRTQSSVEYIETERKENSCLDSKLEKISSHHIVESGIMDKLCDDNRNSKPTTVSDVESVKNIDSNECKYNSKAYRKQSQSETSFTETIISDNCMDSLLYRELRQKRAPKTRKKTSVDCLNISRSDKSKLKFKSETIKSHQDSTIDNEILEDFSRPFSTKKRYNSKNFEIRNPTTSGSQKKFHRNEVELGPTGQKVNRTSTMNQKQLSKYLCNNCSCDSKRRSRPQWSHQRKESWTKFNPRSSEQPSKTFYPSLQLQNDHSRTDNSKLTKNIDSKLHHKFTLVRGNRFMRYTSLFPRRNEDATGSIFTEKFVKSRTFEDPANSSSTGFSEFTESSDRRKRVVCRCPSYKPASNSQHYHGHSHSSNMSSSKRCPSCTVLYQHSVLQKRQPTSSSSCRTSASSTSSVYSQSTDKDGYTFERDNTNEGVRTLFRKYNRISEEETGIIKESRKKPFKLRPSEQKKKRTLYTHNRHVSWGSKHAY
ncbi:hypothetical protein WN55_10469 [Dufourea novaeangliae]|uniref:Uncharacterized protein n=1 Tax=Dufourea novaeangliae TaxID=178035 RepID=A0A154P5T5_DUFNO|nr:hypothetical protein WN55_10469 [Dufourea novaeangliae]